MTWLSIHFNTTDQHAEHLSDALSFAGAKAVTLQDAADQPLLEPNPKQTPLWHQVEVIGLFDATENPEMILTTLRLFVDETLVKNYWLHYIAEEDWVTKTQQDFKPIKIPPLCICPNWVDINEPDCITVKINPGLAFGTGTHPTTALCLNWLSQQSLQQHTVVDFGCGSGILSLAALALGAETVYAIDHDEQALIATQNNYELNQFHGHLTLLMPEDIPEITADILIANIVLKPLIELRDIFLSLLAPHGKIVLSGILASQLPELLQHYQAYFSAYTLQQQEEWLLIEAVLNR
ncbi:MAG: 50S ribosomal protein L11 methyltransferase [Legionellales bacterium]|nr:50S ribosomal protein L11 methyltransferase [Legionellales bacterium]